MSLITKFNESSFSVSVLRLEYLNVMKNRQSVRTIHNRNMMKLRNLILTDADQEERGKEESLELKAFKSQSFSFSETVATKAAADIKKSLALQIGDWIPVRLRILLLTQCFVLAACVNHTDEDVYGYGDRD